MNLTINNNRNYNNLILFSDIPNILELSDEAGGRNSYVEIAFIQNATLSPTADSQYHITVMSDTIDNVLNPENGINKNFYIGTPIQTANNVCKALRNCPSVMAKFNVYIPYSFSNIVRLQARKVGEVGINLDTNIPGSFISLVRSEGYSKSDLQNKTVNLDFYDSTNTDEYVTTLSKTCYGSNIKFDLTPLIATLAKYDELDAFAVKPYTLDKNGTRTDLVDAFKIYPMKGYKVNQGDDYKFATNNYVLQNVRRGTPRNFENNTILYIAGDNIPITYWRGNNDGGTSVKATITVKDSAGLQVSTKDVTTTISSVPSLQNFVLPVDISNAQAAYVDVTIDNATYRYNVIHKGSYESNKRILWHNSYGGVSFFDFVGESSEERSIETSTYTKGLFDYYTENQHELNVVYDKSLTYTVTVKSHYIPLDALYIFNDLAQAKDVWTIINGQQYKIIISDVSVSETANNDVFEVQVKYTYSQPTTFN